jgi:hypothetical protein
MAYVDFGLTGFWGAGSVIYGSKDEIQGFFDSATLRSE